MRVLLDVNSLVAKELTGIGIYVAELASRLRQSSEVNLSGAFKVSRMGKLRDLRQHYNGTVYPNEFIGLPFKKFDVFHGPDFRVPRTSSIKKIMTVHDLVTFRSGFVDPRFEEGGKAELISELREGKPDWIITVSDFTKQELIEFFPEFKDRVTVIYQGFEHQNFLEMKLY